MRGKSSRRRMLLLFSLVSVVVASHPGGARCGVADLDDLFLPPDSFFNGDPGDLNPGESNDGSFSSEGAQFNNLFEVVQFGEDVFKLWSGWSYSNRIDTTTPGFSNQYSAIPGHDASGSGNYGVAFLGGTAPAKITLPAGAAAQSIRVTNTTYTYLAMVDGDDGGAGFVRQFGDDPAVPGGGNQGHPDFLLLEIIGRDRLGMETGTAPFYLADYRFAGNDEDFAVDTWELVDLTPLGPGTRTLDFLLTSSDSGPFGINTPNYFALDDLTFSAPPPVPGDTDGDGDVDVDDLNNVRNHFGQSGMPITGDTNDDGAVDIDDLNNVRNNFGRVVDELSPVPEPTGLLILMTGWAAIAATRVRGRKQAC